LRRGRTQVAEDPLGGKHVNYTDETALPEVTDEMLDAARHSARPYTLVILKIGPNFSPGPERDAKVRNTIWAHGKRNLALRMAGLLPIVCPVADDSDVAGIGIFDASPGEVERILSADPAVIADILTYEIHPTRGFPGSSLPASEAGPSADHVDER
jgi:hypothetical protein